MLIDFFLEACCAAGKEHTKQNFGENGASKNDFHVSLLKCLQKSDRVKMSVYSFSCKLHATFSVFFHILSGSLLIGLLELFYVFSFI